MLEPMPELPRLVALMKLALMLVRDDMTADDARLLQVVVSLCSRLILASDLF